MCLSLLNGLSNNYFSLIIFLNCLTFRNFNLDIPLPTSYKHRWLYISLTGYNLAKFETFLFFLTLQSNFTSLFFSTSLSKISYAYSSSQVVTTRVIFTFSICSLPVDKFHVVERFNDVYFCQCPVKMQHDDVRMDIFVHNIYCGPSNVYIIVYW